MDDECDVLLVAPQNQGFPADAGISALNQTAASAARRISLSYSTLP
jgi:hypothetical protein